MQKRFVGILMFLVIAAITAGAQTPPTLTIVTETPGLPSELFYGNVKVKPVRLRPGTTTHITIDDSDFFVQQQYIDFLRRFPDAPGFAHWVGEIDAFCNNSANRLPGETLPQCIDRKRTNTSGAFYLSNEFQNSANFLIRINWGSLGQGRNACNIVVNGTTYQAICNPLYAQYVTDLGTLTQGIVVNNALVPSQMTANRISFANSFIGRAAFANVYGSLNDTQYVDALAAATGVALTAQERTDLISQAGAPGSACTGFTGFTSGRACVLYKIVDGTTTDSNGGFVFNTRYGHLYYDNTFNPVFVFVQYLAYLRRNPDTGGYDHWFGKLSFYGNFVDAEMVRSFIVSDEYRGRF
jgi:hypothetical protein